MLKTLILSTFAVLIISISAQAATVRSPWMEMYHVYVSNERVFFRLEQDGHWGYFTFPIEGEPKQDYWYKMLMTYLNTTRPDGQKIEQLQVKYDDKTKVNEYYEVIGIAARSAYGASNDGGFNF